MADLPVVIVNDVLETAVMCADRSIHFGHEYLRGMEPEVVVAMADAAAVSTCKRGPHVLVTRHRITTDWAVTR